MAPWKRGGKLARVERIIESGKKSEVAEPTHDPLDPRRRREPTGMNAPVLLCAILFWALGGSWESLQRLLLFGTLNFYYTRAHMRFFDTDIESWGMMAMSLGPTLLTAVSMCIIRVHVRHDYSIPTWREVGLVIAAAFGMLLSGPPVARQDEYEQAMLEALEANGGDESSDISKTAFGAFRDRLLLSELRISDADRKTAKERKAEAREKKKEASREQRRARRDS